MEGRIPPRPDPRIQYGAGFDPGIGVGDTLASLGATSCHETRGSKRATGVGERSGQAAPSVLLIGCYAEGAGKVDHLLYADVKAADR